MSIILYTENVQRGLGSVSVGFQMVQVRLGIGSQACTVSL